MSPVRQRPDKAELQTQTKLWRYFDLDGALNLIRTNMLRFTQLAKFEDGFEGRQSLAEKAKDVADRKAAGIPIFENEQETSWLIEVFNRHHTYASCWTTVSPNSMLMWSIYAPKPESVAVETTVGKLLASLPESGPEVLMGGLDYGNREVGISNSYNPLAAVWSKWDYYAHEREVRLHVNANEFGESHAARCVCQEPEYRMIEFGPNTFDQVYAHPMMGEDLFLGLGAQITSLSAGLKLERTGIRMQPSGD